MKKFKLLFLLPLASALLTGCGPKDEKKGDPDSGEKEQKKEFSGLSLNSGSVTYDGEAHTLELQGTLPAGATATYVQGYEGGTLPGTYEIKILVQCKGYNDKTYTATLTIVNAQFSGLAFEGATEHYDDEVHSLEVSGLPEGASVSYTVNGEEFEGAKAVGQYEIKAVVSQEYYNDAEFTATLTIAPNDYAENNLLIADFEGKNDNYMADEWEFLFYKHMGGDVYQWSATSAAKLLVGHNQFIGDGHDTMRMIITHQGSPFKATNTLGEARTFDKYHGFALDTHISERAATGTAKIQVQFWFKDLPLPEDYVDFRNTYITYTLENPMTKGWTHWEIPFDDESLSIANGYIPTAALSTLGMKIDDFMMYLDKVAVIANQNQIDNGNLEVHFDNIELIANEFDSRVKNIAIPAGRYANNETENVLAINIDANMEDGTFTQNGYKVKDLKVEKYGTSVVCKDAETNGTDLTVSASITDNGLHVDTVTGTLASSFADVLLNKVFKSTSVDCEFEDGVDGNTYNVDSRWKESHYGNSGWTDYATPTQMRAKKDKYNCKIVNFAASTTTYNFKFQPQVEIGKVNHAEVDLGNYYASSTATAIKYKLSLLASNGSTVVKYIAGGDGANWATIAKDSSNGNLLNHFVFDFDTVDAAQLRLTVITDSGSGYLYMDNLKVYLKPSVF